MKKTFLIFVLTVLLIGFAISKIDANYSSDTALQNGLAKIPASEAKNHVGENAIVSGTIIEIKISKPETNVYLYLDGDIKNAQFAAVWPGTNNPPVQALKELIFRAEPIISVSGKIVTEKNVPEIIVSSWSQIQK